MEEHKELIAANREAKFHYQLLEFYEAGLSLLGSEVKSLRLGQINLKGSFARIENAEAYLWNAHIAPYDPKQKNYDPARKRKLLLHRQEINKLIGKTQEKGLALVPTEIYFKRGKAKIVLAVARGKKNIDKRETIKKRDWQREKQRDFKKR
ncbi:MAG: SsrA-binding protein SmpB [Elusimicrobiota bacterium]